MVLQAEGGAQVASDIPTVDLLVIGGGINGSGIAADAAGRGLQVLLCEKEDLGGATSAASTKLIHGGLRYLEYYEFRLVREALGEREVLLRMAPHIIWPIRFRLPHLKGGRPRWMVRAGLFLYDHLGKRTTLPGSRSISLRDDPLLQPSLTRGFEYSDCWVDDSRLVVLNAMLAQQKGAEIWPRTACVGLRADSGEWIAELESQPGGERHPVRARAVVNAAGPWVDQLAGSLQLPENARRPVRLVQGSHIVVPRLYEGDHAWLLQHTDGRVIFLIPYEEEFTLIGTTETALEGDPSQAGITPAEIRYLLDAVNRYLRTPVTESDMVHSFSGVRPLVEEEGESASRLSRDYQLVLNRQPAPMLTVYGGKITTYRRLAEAALNELRAVFPQLPGDWTAGATLPGGDFREQEELFQAYRQRWGWLPDRLLRRWVRTYGTRIPDLLDGASELDDLGRHFGGGLHRREVDWLMEQEWARTADDILWRRTRMGLHMTGAERQALTDWMAEQESGQCID